MIELVDLKKKIGERYITNGVNLFLPENKMTVIIGKSGEGKSLLLKQLIGLVEPTSGKILLENNDLLKLTVEQKKIALKKFGYVFQYAALLDSLTIFENILLPIQEYLLTDAEKKQIVYEKLELVNLSPSVLSYYPAEISGGMRKRVGLARTLMTDPKIILYDEPTTGLDPITTRIIHELMFDLQKLKVTSIVVSHDLEIFKYADFVALLHEGAIVFNGPSSSIWKTENPFVNQFIRGFTKGPINN